MADVDLSYLLRTLTLLLIEQELRRTALEMTLIEANVHVSQTRLDFNYDDARAASKNLIDDVQTGSLESLQAHVATLLQAAQRGR